MLTIFVKSPIGDVRLGSNYASTTLWLLFTWSLCTYCFSRMFQRCSFKIAMSLKIVVLTLSWQRSLSYRSLSTDFLCKPMKRFLYDRDLHHERVKTTIFNDIAILKLHLWNILEQQYVNNNKEFLSLKFEIFYFFFRPKVYSFLVF